MMQALDNLLNRITMYRLMIYVLGALLAWGAALGFIGRLSFSGWSIIGSTVLLVIGAWMGNKIIAWAFKAPAHNPSAYITALILALIVTPIRTSEDLLAFIWIIVLAIAGKYILAVRRQHIFNPAALSVTVTAVTIGASASWWVGNIWILPVVLIGGYLIVRKIRRWDVVWAFLASTAVTITMLTLLRDGPLWQTWKVLLLNAPLFFFAMIMLTEPMTMPPTKRWRVAYGLLIGFFFAPQWHIGAWYSTPELALVIGNAVFFLVSGRERYTLRLLRKEQIIPGVYDLVFTTNRPVPYESGQYMEFTVPQHRADQRGWRRYFTLASSPTEQEVRLGVKFYLPASTFKQKLLAIKPGDTIVAAQRDGDFTLPKNTQTKLAFIAGGIGVTPFRSMIKYLLDIKQPRPITLLYASQTTADFAYQELFEQAKIELGIRAVNILGDLKQIPPTWTGERGYITAEMIQRQVPDYAERLFYISGPAGMVRNYQQVLRSMGIPARQIKTDYFPGYA